MAKNEKQSNRPVKQICCSFGPIFVECLGGDAALVISGKDRPFRSRYRALIRQDEGVQWKPQSAGFYDGPLGETYAASPDGGTTWLFRLPKAQIQELLKKAGEWLNSKEGISLRTRSHAMKLNHDIEVLERQIEQRGEELVGLENALREMQELSDDLADISLSITELEMEEQSASKRNGAKWQNNQEFWD